MSGHPRCCIVVSLTLALSGCERAAQREVEQEVVREVERAAGRTLDREMSAVLRRDTERDALLPARGLARDRTVYRYTTRDGAIGDAESGIAEGVHMTARGGPGRPLGAAEAQRLYGLPNEPEVRESIRLTRGQSVKTGKVIGGARGVGEITTAERMEGKAVKTIVRLH